ncbi:MAG: CsbD family protein [Alkalinema sp. RU_4_3]|nr:CsbD family protein [Alkalinema sp. RU_4_3]
MSLEDKAKAVAKNLEGKAQEVVGKVTGDKSDEAAGKAKQAEASGRHAVEDAKMASRKPWTNGYYASG